MRDAGCSNAILVEYLQQAMAKDVVDDLLAVTAAVGRHHRKAAMMTEGEVVMWIAAVQLSSRIVTTPSCDLEKTRPQGRILHVGIARPRLATRSIVHRFG
jgi:hypothetical protein